ncbi:hypothetical protein RDT67_13130 [Serratia fonticola]|jgi:hypothetical protein|uniref:Pilus assembly protein n=1 Tax=Serratia fonticola TaxID=47917 RepID=A0AAJ1YCS1_SERFO|nr:MULTISPECIES: hypothetical protein [Serratia]MCO7509157.1 hypothetical protein [Serratia fonticola]MDQ9127377.1 hypothetical protein [Serratia fonticola]OKP26382.1 hypothetical protein BSQ40_19220 [Serratia fonticola]WMT16806.1 hypothetical protein RFB13_11030 [Serratia fonticola]
MSLIFWRGLSVLMALLLVHSSYAGGLLSLSQAELTVPLQGRLPELVVENRGDGPLYLEVRQQLLTNPGLQPETLIDVGHTESPSLLVMPSRLILGPGQKRTMQLRVLSAPAKTQVWRITFRPQQHLSVTTAGSTPAGLPLLVSIGYGVVIYQTGSQS